MRFLVGLLICIPLTTVAAEQFPVPNGLSLCQEFQRPYEFSALVESELSEIAPGASMFFTGVLENRGTGSLENPTVIVRISPKDAPQHITDLVSAELVPRESGMSLRALWNVPNGIRPGIYEAEAVLLVDGREVGVGSVGGIPRNSPYEFRVVNLDGGSVYFDPTQTFLNGTEVSAAPLIAPEGALTFGIRVVNDTERPLKSSIVWKVYAARGMREDKLLTEARTPIKVHAGIPAITTFAIADTTHPEYFVVGELEGSITSRTYHHVVRSVDGQPRLTSAGHAVRGSEEVVYLCVESPVVESDNVRLVLTQIWSVLGFEWRRELGAFSGSVPPGATYAFVRPAPSGGDTLAELYRGEALVDSSRIQGKGDSFVWGLGLFTVFLLVISAWILMKYKLL